MRKWTQLLARTACALALLTVLAAVAQAQRTKIGGRLGVNFDSDEALIGLLILAPLTSRVDFYPSIDVYLPDRGSRTGINLDIRILFPDAAPPTLYLGGGLNVLRRSFRGESDSDAGLNLFGGIEFRSGTVHPFFEGRVLLHDESSFQLMGGFSIVIG